MTDKAKAAVNAVMGVLRAQTGALSANDRYDALDEISHEVAEKFAAAENALTVWKGGGQQVFDGVDSVVNENTDEDEQC